MKFVSFICLIALACATVSAGPVSTQQQSLQPVAAPAVAPAAVAPVAVPVAPRLAAKRSDSDSDSDAELQHLAQMADSQAAEIEHLTEQSQEAAAVVDTNAQAETHTETQWDILGIGGKDKGHEDLTKEAAATLPQLHIDSLVNGVQYNDMPAPGDDPDDRATLAEFAIKFGLKTDKPNNIVYQSHYGCLQHWHAMTPMSERPPADKKAKADLVAFNNKQVYDFILEQQKKWWNLALEHAVARQKMLGAAAAAPAAAETWKTGAVKEWNKADFVLGHMLHTIQDSFAMAHGFRGGEDIEQGDGCGLVYMFQGYGGQSSKLHGNDDHTPKATDGHRFRMYNCAKKFTKQLLEKWSACKVQIDKSAPQTVDSGNKCVYATEVEPLLQKIYQLEATAQTRVSGLTHDKYVEKAELDKKFAKQDKTKYELKTEEIAINIGTNAAEFANLTPCKADATKKCATFTGIVSKINYDPATMPRDICPAKKKEKTNKCLTECKPNPNPKWYNAKCICKAEKPTAGCDVSCAACRGDCTAV